MIYKELEKRIDEDISVYIFYLEIYKEIGFDFFSIGVRIQLVVILFLKVRIQFVSYFIYKSKVILIILS